MEVLREIQDTAILYANILSEILKIDVTIVDTTLRRVAGTGRMEKQVDRDISEEGHIFAQTLKTCRTQVVDTPGENEICRKYCSHINDCKETFHMSTPIMEKGKPIGVICFTCYTQKQRTHAMRNKESFQRFLQQFADLIALKAAEKRETQRDAAMKELLKTIVNHLDAGVLVLNQQAQVVELNSMCCEILKLPESQIYAEKATISDTGNQIGGFEEYRVRAGGNSYHLAGRLIELGMEEGMQFLLFKQAERTMKESLGLRNRNRLMGIMNIEGESPQAKKLKQEILKVADSPSSVLILGEKGLEKDKIVRAIHEESRRKEQLFVTVNCAVEDPERLEKELFGIAGGKNSKGKVGKLEAASKGTVVLEDVEKLTQELQRKIWQFLESGSIIRCGGTRKYRTSARMLFTSSADLSKMAEEGSFLYPLYYRISVLLLRVPPLRERQGDIHYFAQKYLQQYADSMKKEIRAISPEVYRCVDAYTWPGNLWEIRNAMEYAVNMMKLDGTITMEELPERLWLETLTEEDEEENLNLEAMEKRMIEKAILRYGKGTEDKKKVAEALGIGMATLYRKIKKYQIEI
ncbi:sigma 54-interacting transcriptional regulator [Blautia sp. MSJ-19]|uniref:sigma 54-interacting transcriptional regulator n=1 Tax=Blautia sp. MSJ-19 TaxID=2841517 RepID=UPI001C0EB650|nr:sigma 54-interacting transcriptional regulator [Blautia sp. MSJ-19]MBU5480320.1 sigma 54-interacting transcriptional regulator [Blautia sp. MSJ-19]